MVLRKPVGGHLHPTPQSHPQLPPLSPTSSLYSPPSNTGELPSTLLNEHLQHNDQNLRNEDSDSDWDASDREDNIREAEARQGKAREEAAGRPPQPNIHIDQSTKSRNEDRSRRFTPPPSPRPAELSGSSPFPLPNNHEPFDAEGLDTLAQSLSINTKSQPPYSAPGRPLSPVGTPSTNPFRREPSSERAYSANQARTPQAALAPTNPFRQPASASATDLISFDSNDANYVPRAVAQSAFQRPENTPAYPRKPLPSGPGVRASSIFDADVQPELQQQQQEQQQAPNAASHTGESSASAVAAVAAASTATQNASRKERNQVYQIRKILWKDPTSANSLRESPILIQNANGPCPLLALVNALVLSTPPSMETALVETLRTRENISLGLLLDAVFDELMSGRRGTTALQLPDVHQLYTFLLALHTGMNVNPRFIHEQGGRMGAFEQTNEMVLYGTFDLPLMHGWLPGPDDPAYAAFARSAPNYEDTQSLLFREDELEKGLNSGQLNAQDEAAFIDLTVIKEFLNQWPTQLSSHGLSVINDTIRSCQIGILFRNDHFSTMYKEPSSGHIMTLVTDAGFASHAEVVWESLVDVNGSGSEFFSGDFRPVSHAAQSQRQPAPTSHQAHGGQRTEQSNRPTSPVAQPVDASAHTRSTSEQEDHDLALAMQLQEEEEERDRRNQAARRRDERLSEQYLSQDSMNRREQQGPSIPPRRSQQTTPPARQHDTDTDAAPPTYEESRRDRPYNPPPGAPPGHDQLGDSSSDSRRAPRRARNSSGAPTPLGGSSAMAQQRSPYMTTHEAVAERREGCTIQ